MARNFKMPNKKATTIAIITVIALLTIAITGTVVFLKDRGDTEAAEFTTEQLETSQEQTNTVAQNGEAQVQENGEQTTEVDGNQSSETQTTEGEAVTGAEGATESTTSTTGATGTGTTTGTSTTGTTNTDRIQETTIVDREVINIPEKKVSEGHLVGWVPRNLDSTYVNAIDGIDDETDVVKTVETEIGENVVVSEGIITYHVNVKNKTDRDLYSVEVKDFIPAKTTYEANSADNTAQEIKDGDTVIALRWYVDIKAGENTTVSFRVKVNKDETGLVINKATANGEESNKVQTAIIKQSKSKTITRIVDGKEIVVQEPAKIGDIITYALTVENTGDLAGNTTIKDRDLADLLINTSKVNDGKLEFYYGTKENPFETLISQKDALEENSRDRLKVLQVEDLIDGIEKVKIPLKPQTVSIVFKLEITKVDGKKIENQASIGEKTDVPTNKEEIETIDYSLTKNIEKVELKEINEQGQNVTKQEVTADFDKVLVKVGDTITYKIVAQNNGSAVLQNVKILDDKTVTLISATLPTRLQEKLDKEAQEAGIDLPGELPTLGQTVASTDYNNPVNNSEIKDNLLGRNDLDLQPGEEIVLIVSHDMVEEDITGENYTKLFINNAKFVGYYKEQPYEDTDYAAIDTIEISLTKDLTKITIKTIDAVGKEVKTDITENLDKKLVEEGSILTYNIVAKNNGSETLKNVKILDDKTVTLVGATLPTRLQEQLDKEAQKVGAELPAQLTTINKTIESTDYNNPVNNEQVKDNLLGRNDLDLKPGEEIILTVTYEIKDVTKTIINNAKFIGYYENESYEETDKVPTETIDLSLTKTVTAINGAPTSKDGVEADVKKIQKVNDTVTYTIVVKNDGSATLNNIKVLDDKKVKVDSVTLPQRLQNIIDEEAKTAGKEVPAKLNTINKTINAINYNNNKVKATDNLADNLLGRNDFNLMPGEEITFVVTHTFETKQELVGIDKFINNAKILGFYKEETQERDDDAEVVVDYIPEKTNLAFEKVWFDKDTVYDVNRPENITVELQMKNKQGKWVKVTGRTDSEITLPEADGSWDYKWINLDAEFKDNGNPIEYKVVETKIGNVAYTEQSDYVAETSNTTITDNGKTIKKITITNKYQKPQGGEIVKKYLKEQASLRDTPLDVAFVIDTSLSMTQNGSSRAEDMRKALNSAIKEIQSYNDYNRISVVGFCEAGTYGHNNPSDASVLLELGRYKAVSGNEYLKKSATDIKVNGETIHKFTTNVQKQNENSYSTSNKTYSNYSTRTRYIEQGTYTQAGIKLGAEQLLATTNTKVTLNGKQVQRIPIMILLSDGEPTFYTEDYNFYNETSKKATSASDVKLGTGALKTTTAEYGYYTILTANYYKNKITNHYNKTQTKVITIAMDLATHYGATVLNPNAANMKTAKDYVEKIGTENPKNGIADTEISQKLWKYLKNKISGITNPYSNFSYADKGFNEKMDTNDLKNAIIETIKTFVPTSASWTITSTEITNGKAALPNLDTSAEFTLTAGILSYSGANACQNAITAGVVDGNETDGYYINLTKVPAGSRVTVTYTSK